MLIAIAVSIRVLKAKDCLGNLFGVQRSAETSGYRSFPINVEIVPGLKHDKGPDKLIVIFHSVEMLLEHFLNSPGVKNPVFVQILFPEAIHDKRLEVGLEPNTHGSNKTLFPMF